ncbi:MAG: ABC-type sugar transport system, periplasmic component, partial [Actinomycetia bacterium]|nr:ABC-type sugar transport system, periplasmic component [Actinomycetes bacterium]
VAGARQAAATPKCPLGALAKAHTPVHITMWHSMISDNEKQLKAFAAAFNASQSAVVVDLVNQSTYDDTLTKYTSGLSTGDLPDLVQMESTSLQRMIDTHTIVPASSCIAKDKSFAVGGMLPRIRGYYTTGKTMWAVPWNVANMVVFWNKKAFTTAGLDPAKPPTTLDELHADALKIKQSGAARAGFAYKYEPWYLEQWAAMTATPLVNNGNGRKARATKATLDNPAMRSVFSFLAAVAKDGSGVTVGDRDSFDNLLALGNGGAGIAIDTSGALGTAIQALAAGAFPGLAPSDIGVAPMPGPKGTGGAQIGGGALYIVSKSSPAKQEASYRFAKYLAATPQTAQWSTLGFVPLRSAAITVPVLTDQWAKYPQLKVPFDQVQGKADVATAGPVIGAYPEVRAALIKAMQQVAVDHASPTTALEAAQAAANTAIADYNSRVQ